jgi:hypothetical protein
LVATLSHFPELEIELGLLRSTHDVGLTEDQVDAIWIHVRPASDSLASHVLPSVARGPPDGAGE